MKTEFLAGFSTEDITPPVGTELFGNNSLRVSTGVLEPLYARAMAWKSGNTKGVIITCDLCLLSRDYVLEIRKSVFSSCGILFENIMVCCLHTHSGPNTCSNFHAHGEINPGYVKGLPGRIADAAVKAFALMEPSTLEYCEQPVEGIGCNREYEDGKTDPCIRMLLVKSKGRLKGFIANYSCHPVVMNCFTYLISSDFVGIAMNRVMEKYDVTGLFLQGSCGDINSLYFNNPQEQALPQLKLLSERFANYLESGLKASNPVEVDLMKTASFEVALPFDRLSKPLLLRHLKLVDEMLGYKELPVEARRSLLFEKTGFEGIWKHYDSDGSESWKVEIQAFRFGDVIIAANPGELFYSIQEKIFDAVRPYKIMLAGYSNDSVGYIPTADKFDVSQRIFPYSVYWVPIAFSKPPFRQDVGEILSDGITGMIKSLI